MSHSALFTSSAAKLSSHGNATTATSDAINVFDEPHSTSNFQASIPLAVATPRDTNPLVAPSDTLAINVFVKTS